MNNKANITNNNRNSDTAFGNIYRPPSGYSSGSSNIKALLAGGSEVEVYY